MLFDKIIERENEFVNYCDNYSGQKICLFGSGEGAVRVYRYLQKRNISVASIAGTRDYIESARKRMKNLVGGVEVDIFENIISGNTQYDIVVCFAGWDSEYFKAFDNVESVFNLDIFSGLPEIGSLSTVPYSYYDSNRDDLEWIYKNLADKKSEDCMASYINQRISGKYEYSLDLVDEVQYIDETVYSFGDGEVYIDCGGYDGMDTKNFLDRAGSNSKAFVFEADKKNIKLIDKNLSEYDDEYTIINKAVYNDDVILKFKSDGTTDSKISDEGDTEVICTSIDKTVGEDEKVSFIKMDIEGSELMALKGAKKTIRRCKPRLAICIYHKPEDIIEIPKYILSINPDYKLFVRRYDRLCIETVLYAV